MKYFAYKTITNGILLGLSLLAGGCMAVKEDDPEPCPQGLEVRFIYDYNLDRANAFHKQVDCLSLHIYDSNGRFVRTIHETSGALADEDYRMIIDDLPEGDYRLIAYGGATCEKSSFSYTTVPAFGTLDTEAGMQLNPECLERGNERGHLHDHFYGSVYANVKVAPQRTKVTVPMMKNTNTFRILLQNLNYEPLDGNDYDFEIIDDNTLFDHSNDLVDNGNVTYTAWDKGSLSSGSAETLNDTRVITEVKLAYGDLSTSRLMMKRKPVLRVTHLPTATKVIELPLKYYMLDLRNGHYSWAGDQEFLDRKSDWQFFFFLDDNRTWNKTIVKVDDWTVRVNDIKN